MRHIFILNPKAGKTAKALTLEPLIREYFETHTSSEDSYRIYVTTYAGEATEIARREGEMGDVVRFYACGGDGTMMEVATGMSAYKNAELTCIPCGSANDYIRGFGDMHRFADLEQIVGGESVWVDAISCNGKLSLNICSMGMDADVAMHMTKYKKWPFVSGVMAYNLSILRTFFHRLGRKLQVEMDIVDSMGVRTVNMEGDFLFALAANGQYYGGGYRGAPQADPSDSLMNFVLIEKVGRLRILSLLKQYRAGEHLSLGICHSYQGVRMKVRTDSPASVNVDGECFADTEVAFDLLPQCIRFVLPKALCKRPCVHSA